MGSPVAPPQGPPQAAPPQGAASPSGGGGSSVGSLHDHALQAEKHLEQLATGLAQAGADPQTIKAVSQMAEVTRKIVGALGKGQEQTGNRQPPAQAPDQQQPKTIMEAAHQLHSTAQAAAAQGGQ